MKLIFCPNCDDVIRLKKSIRTCTCVRSWGMYLEDGLHAKIGGDAIPLGFNNMDFVRALGEGGEFIAFVIELPCATIEKD